MRERVHAHAATNARIEIFDQSVGVVQCRAVFLFVDIVWSRDDFVIGGSPRPPQIIVD